MAWLSTKPGGTKPVRLAGFDIEVGAPALVAALTFSLVASAAEFIPEPAKAENLSADEWRQLENGDAVVRSQGEGDTSAAAAWALVDAGPGLAFSAFDRHEQDPKFSSCLKISVVLSRSADAGVEQIKVRETHEGLFKMRYTIDYTHDRSRREIRWALDKAAKNDMAAFSGSWRFVPVGERRTLLVYTASGDAGGLIPRSMQNALMRVGLPDLVKESRRRVEAYRP